MYVLLLLQCSNDGVAGSWLQHMSASGNTLIVCFLAPMSTVRSLRKQCASRTDSIAQN